MNKLELGQKIRALRKERKQTLETLAEAADIGLGYLGEIESGIKMPSLSEQLQSLTQEEAAAVLSILETTIQQVKNLRNETV